LQDETTKRQYWNPYVGGALLGVLLFLTFFLTGHGLGSSGGVNRIVVAIEDIFVPEHVDRTPYLAEMAGGERNPLDHWIVWQVAGILVGGSCACAMAAGAPSWVNALAIAIPAAPADTP